MSTARSNKSVINVEGTIDVRQIENEIQKEVKAYRTHQESMFTLLDCLCKPHVLTYVAITSLSSL